MDILYRSWLDGDDTALEQIVSTHRHSLTLFLYRYLQDYDAAEELAIDVFAEMVLHPHRYNFKTPLKTYLFMIGRSRAIDRFRRERRRQTVPLSELNDRPDRTPPPVELLIADERREALSHVLSELPPDMQAVLHLIYIEEFSYDEAAKILKKNRKQIDNLLYRSKVILRQRKEEFLL